MLPLLRRVWSQPGAVAFADGSGAHVACYEQAEAARIRAAAGRAVESPDALADGRACGARGVVAVRRAAANRAWEPLLVNRL